MANVVNPWLCAKEIPEELPPKTCRNSVDECSIVALWQRAQGDGDPKEVLRLVDDEQIEYKSTPIDNPGLDVPREQIDVKMKHLDKVQDQPYLNYNLDSVRGMAKLRSIYMDYCISEFMNYEGFGSRGRKAFLNVVAARPTQQYVLGTKEKAVRTGYLPQWFGAAQLSFMTLLREDWWPLFQVLARGPYTTFGLEQSEMNEFHSQHVVQLYTQQPNVFTPPVNTMFVGLEHGRMYTIYKQVPKGQHQIMFGPLKSFTLKNTSLNESICHVKRQSLGVLRLRSPEVFWIMLHSLLSSCFVTSSLADLRKTASCRSTYPTLPIVVTDRASLGRPHPSCKPVNI